MIPFLTMPLTQRSSSVRRHTPRYTWLVRLALSLTEDEFVPSYFKQCSLRALFSELQNTFFHKIKECEMILSCCLFYGDIHITVTITTDVVAWGALEQSAES